MSWVTNELRVLRNPSNGLVFQLRRKLFSKGYIVLGVCGLAALWLDLIVLVLLFLFVCLLSFVINLVKNVSYKELVIKDQKVTLYRIKFNNRIKLDCIDVGDVKLLKRKGASGVYYLVEVGAAYARIGRKKHMKVLKNYIDQVSS